jgi:hypothetical protein
MAHVAVVATGTAAASTLTATATVATATPAGTTVLGGCVWESAAGSIPVGISVSDTRSNSWSTDSTAGGASNVTDACAQFRARLTTGLQVGDTITVSITTATRSIWAMQFDSFDDINTSPVDQTATPTNNATGTSMAVGPTGTLAQAYELAYGVFGFNGARTSTPTAPWSGAAQVTGGSGTLRAIQCVYQYTSATTALTSAASQSTSSVYCGTLVTYKATAATSKNPQTISQYGGYF